MSKNQKFVFENTDYELFHVRLGWVRVKESPTGLFSTLRFVLPSFRLHYDSLKSLIKHSYFMMLSKKCILSN